MASERWLLKNIKIEVHLRTCLPLARSLAFGELYPGNIHCFKEEGYHYQWLILCRGTPSGSKDMTLYMRP